MQQQIHKKKHVDRNTSNEKKNLYREQMSGRNTKKTTRRLAAKRNRNYCRMKQMKLDNKLAKMQKSFSEDARNHFRARVLKWLSNLALMLFL